jgi:CheY-like chemotaxis protein
MARVLVADDEGSTRALVRMILQLEGHTVVEAEDGRFALASLQNDGPFDVLVLDLMMPWVDGWEVLRNVQWAPPRVIVLTARDDPYAEQRAERSKTVFRYMTKPYDPDDLVNAVKEAIEAT